MEQEYIHKYIDDCNSAILSYHLDQQAHEGGCNQRVIKFLFTYIKNFNTYICYTFIVTAMNKNRLNK